MFCERLKILGFYCSVCAMKTNPPLSLLSRISATAWLLLFWFNSPANAQAEVEEQTVSTQQVTANVRDNPIYERLIEIVNFLSVGVVLVIAISVAVSGLQYVTSRGDPNATAKAINRMVQAATALIFYVFGWAILNWLVPGGVI